VLLRIMAVVPPFSACLLRRLDASRQPGC
jgi:hypothetical protein